MLRDISAHLTPRVDTRNVRFFLSPAQAVLPFGRRLDGAGNGVLVRLRERPRRIVRAGSRRRGAVLVGAVTVVRSLLCPLRCNFCRSLDLVLTASVGSMVDPRVRADPVDLLLSG